MNDIETIIYKVRLNQADKFLSTLEEYTNILWSNGNRPTIDKEYSEEVKEGNIIFYIEINKANNKYALKYSDEGWWDSGGKAMYNQPIIDLTSCN